MAIDPIKNQSIAQCRQDELVGLETQAGRSMGHVWLLSESTVIIVPAANHRTLELEKGTAVEIQTPTSNGLETYQGEILDVRAVPAVLLGNIKPVATTQRRKFTRIPAKLKVLLWLNENDIAPERAIPCVTRDISANGILITVTNQLASQMNERIVLQLIVPDNHTVLSRGIVRRFTIRDSGNVKSYDLGIEFDNIDPEDREMLVKYVLRQQYLRSKD